MKILSVSLFTLLSLACIYTPPMFGAQESRPREVKATDSADGLQISIHLGGEQFRTSDTAQLKVELKNIGDVPLMIHKDIGWYGDTSFGLSITDEHHQRVNPTVLIENFPTTPLPVDDFITLKPGESHEQERRLVLKWYQFEESGEYVLTATYWGASKDFVPESLRGRTWRGEQLKSKPIKFKVVKE